MSCEPLINIKRQPMENVYSCYGQPIFLKACLINATGPIPGLSTMSDPRESF